MVNVCVCYEDGLDRKRVPGQQIQNTRNLVPRVDHHRFAGNFVPKNRAVTTEQPYWNGLADHKTPWVVKAMHQAETQAISLRFCLKKALGYLFAGADWLVTPEKTEL